MKNSKGDIIYLKVNSISSQTGTSFSWFCRNLIISTGGTAFVPKIFKSLTSSLPSSSSSSSSPPPRLIHTSQFLQTIDHLIGSLLDSYHHLHSHPTSQTASELVSRIDSLSPRSDPSLEPHESIPTSRSPSSHTPSSSDTTPTTPDSNPRPVLRIAVLGGGQSAAEATLETYHRFSNQSSLSSGLMIEIDLIIRRGHLHPSDDSGFSNEIFDPEATDFFYELGSHSSSSPHVCHSSNLHQAPPNLPNSLDSRAKVLEESKMTNYGVVNPETLRTVRLSH